jgi:hypothetical protein
MNWNISFIKASLTHGGNHPMSGFGFGLSPSDHAAIAAHVEGSITTDEFVDQVMPPRLHRPGGAAQAATDVYGIAANWQKLGFTSEAARLNDVVNACLVTLNS